jgi:hypothetical protein
VAHFFANNLDTIPNIAAKQGVRQYFEREACRTDRHLMLKKMNIESLTRTYVRLEILLLSFVVLPVIEPSFLLSFVTSSLVI